MHHPILHPVALKLLLAELTDMVRCQISSAVFENMGWNGTSCITKIICGFSRRTSTIIPIPSLLSDTEISIRQRVCLFLAIFGGNVGRQLRNYCFMLKCKDPLSP